MKYLIVGLGNLGDEYDLTRHNIGFITLDHFAKKFNIKFVIKKNALYTSVKYKNRILHLIKPSNYVNNSGKSVNYWMNKLKINTENTLVILDDISLPFGKIRIKKNGSDGGHNGLKSINESLNSKNYNRIRFGVDNNFSPGKQSQYVLSKFSKNENKTLELEIESCIDAILSFCTVGVDRTMNKFN